MFYEFQAFLTYIRTRDFAARDTLLNHSLAAAHILDTARKQAGIVFPNSE